jgi:hypothetical protein
MQKSLKGQNLDAKNIVCLMVVCPSGKVNSHMIFEVLTVASMKMTVFWILEPCSLVDIYQCFRGACCHHYQGLDDTGSRHLRNVSELLPDYMVQQPRRQPTTNVDQCCTLRLTKFDVV